jgi:hypothetical protein
MYIQRWVCNWAEGGCSNMGLLRKWQRLIHNTDCPTTKYIYRERKQPQCMLLILGKSHRRGERKLHKR